MTEYNFATSALLTTRDILNFIDYCVQDTLLEKEKQRKQQKRLLCSTKELLKYYGISQRRLVYMKKLGIPTHRLNARKNGYDIQEVNNWLTENCLWDYLGIQR